MHRSLLHGTEIGYEVRLVNLFEYFLHRCQYVEKFVSINASRRRRWVRIMSQPPRSPFDIASNLQTLRGLRKPFVLEYVLCIPRLISFEQANNNNWSWNSRIICPVRCCGATRTFENVISGRTRRSGRVYARWRTSCQAVWWISQSSRVVFPHGNTRRPEATNVPMETTSECTNKYPRNAGILCLPCHVHMCARMQR